MVGLSKVFEKKSFILPCEPSSPRTPPRDNPPTKKKIFLGSKTPKIIPREDTRNQNCSKPFFIL